MLQFNRSKLIVLIVAGVLCLASGVSYAANKTYKFNPNASGTSGKGITKWGLDVKWPRSKSKLQTDISNAGGSGNFSFVRIAWYPQYALNADGSLKAGAKADMDVQKDRASVLSGKKWFLSPKLGGIDWSYYKGSDNLVRADRWANAMAKSREYLGGKGKFAYVGPTNEPDNGNKFTANKFVKIVDKMTDWGGVTIVGPCAFNAATSNNWWNTIKNKVSIGTTHAIGGTTKGAYKSFADKVGSKGPWNSEIHSLAEAIIGGHKGYTAGVYWGAINKARGDFIKYSRNKRIQYGEFGSFGASAIYKGNNAKELYLFIGSNSGSHKLTYKASFNVSYDGSAKKKKHIVNVSGKTERVIKITW